VDQVSPKPNRFLPFACFLVAHPFIVLSESLKHSPIMDFRSYNFLSPFDFLLAQIPKLIQNSSPTQVDKSDCDTWKLFHRLTNERLPCGSLPLSIMVNLYKIFMVLRRIELVTSHKHYTNIHYQYAMTLVLNYMGRRLYLSLCIIMVGRNKRIEV
jgi:hypothetical protein